MKEEFTNEMITAGIEGFLSGALIIFNSFRPYIIVIAGFLLIREIFMFLFRNRNRKKRRRNN